MKEIITYLNFDGNCREAMTFYAKGLGLDLQMSSFADMPGERMKEAGDRIAHARLNKGTTPFLMASDTMPGTPFQAGNNFSVSVTCESLEEIERMFPAVAEGGTITMPLGDQFWGARFGMLADRFGVRWMFSFEHPKK